MTAKYSLGLRALAKSKQRALYRVTSGHASAYVETRIYPPKHHNRMTNLIPMNCRLVTTTAGLWTLSALLGCAPTTQSTADVVQDTPSASDAATSMGNDAPASVDMDTSTDGVGAATPQPPLLVSARLVSHGTMSLAWQYPNGPCMSVEINRNKDGGAFMVSQTLTGAAMAATEMPGHANGRYCFTLTCKSNGRSSMPSNEMCVSQ